MQTATTVLIGYGQANVISKLLIDYGSCISLFTIAILLYFTYIMVIIPNLHMTREPNALARAINEPSRAFSFAYFVNKPSRVGSFG